MIQAQTEGSRAVHALLDLLDALLDGETAFDGTADVNHQHRLLDGATHARLQGIKARLEALTLPKP